MGGVHASPAIDARAFLPIHAQRLVPSPQLVGRLEPGVRVEVLDPWSADRARDVALLRIDRLFLSQIAFTHPRIEENGAVASACTVGIRQPPDLLEGDDSRPLRSARLEMAGLHKGA